jgi:predicted nucleic acid-binding protein
MIYLDSCYILKCYLTENGSGEVRALTQSAEGLASCALAKVEFAAAVLRHRREGKLSDPDAAAVFRDFESDQRSGFWTWFGVTEALLNEAAGTIQRLPASTFLRTNDAIHLACARQQGFQDIYSNDRHLLGAAGAFCLNGIDVIP